MRALARGTDTNRPYLNRRYLAQLGISYCGASLRRMMGGASVLRPLSFMQIRNSGMLRRQAAR
jgi:hypothetical protein